MMKRFPLRKTWSAYFAGPRLVVPALAVLSLGFAGRFLAHLHAADADQDAGVVLNRALRSRFTSASAALDARATVSDVVTNALAFEALLTTSQQAVLQETYTASLARKWSNLPCANTCRNGIGLGTLTSDQLAAALAVIQSATSTASNEGFDKFQQIRMADDNLNANGGGSSYGSGLYYLSFLNAPSTTGAWMMQFGGHHYAAYISFNQGHVVSATPYFYGVEPTSFTVNQTTYTPLALEHDAMTAMLASLSTSQLASAQLTQTFRDATMIPGETNGGERHVPHHQGRPCGQHSVLGSTAARTQRHETVDSKYAGCNRG
jgi:Protein of unknown function (DUF3500)